MNIHVAGVVCGREIAQRARGYKSFISIGIYVKRSGLIRSTSNNASEEVSVSFRQNSPARRSNRK